MITILFSSFNGEDTLPLMLERFLELEVPSCGVQIVAVDNGSTDSTKTIIFSYMDRLPIEYVFESKQGKNAALNTGLKHVKGELIIFTDDDVLPEKKWLSHYTDMFAKLGENFMFCGKVVPHWQKPLPEWLYDTADRFVLYAETPSHLQTGKIPAQLMLGPNMAISAKVFSDGLKFDESVGPNGQPDYIMGSETSLVEKLEHLDFEAWYEKDCVVEHIIRPHQSDVQWMLQRGIRFGRRLFSNESKRFNDPIPTIFGVPRYLFRSAVILSVLRVISPAIISLKRNYSIQWRISVLKGQLIEHRTQISRKRLVRP